MDHEKMLFYGSWLQIINDKVKTEKMQNAIIAAIVKYGLTGEKADLGLSYEMFMEQVYVQIDMAQDKYQKRSEAGRKGGEKSRGGGAPKGNKNASKSENNKQTTSKQQAKTSKQQANKNKNMNIMNNSYSCSDHSDQSYDYSTDQRSEEVEEVITGSIDEIEAVWKARSKKDD